MGRYVEDPDDPDHVIDLDEVDASARLRAERALADLPIDTSRRDRLAQEEARAVELTAPAPRARARSGGGWVLVLYALGMPLALLVRLCTAPWREALRHRARRRADRARKGAIERAMRLARDTSSGEPKAYLASGLAWLAIGEAARAEAAFDTAVERSRADPTGGVHTAATHDRGIARARLGLPKLAARDTTVRAALAPPPRGGRTMAIREGLTFVRIGLTIIAGLGEDD